MKYTVKQTRDLLDMTYPGDYVVSLWAQVLEKVHRGFGAPAYKRLPRLGSGSYGTVYAWSETLAIKLCCDYDRSPDYHRNLLDIVGLDVPGIVNYYAGGRVNVTEGYCPECGHPELDEYGDCANCYETPGTPAWFVMERLVDEGEKPPVTEAAEALSEYATAHDVALRHLLKRPSTGEWVFVDLRIEEFTDAVDTCVPIKYSRPAEERIGGLAVF